MHPPDSTPGLHPAHDLTAFLASLSAEHGHAIPFERFMQEALYHPEFGYYTAHVDRIGRHGDFSTSATLLPELAESIADWISECSGTCQKFRPVLEYRNPEDFASSATGKNQPRHPAVSCIELGPGDGTLSLGILNALPWRLRRKLRLHLVEISPVLEALQRKSLARHTKQVTWHRDIHSALEACHHEALIFSNEFVDAFPAIVLRRNAEETAWDQLHVSFDPARGLREIFRPFPAGTPSSIFNLQSSITTGDRVELHLSYRDWLQSWLPSLRPGSRLLTVDYGDTAENLYGCPTGAKPQGEAIRVQRAPRRLVRHSSKSDGGSLARRPGHAGRRPGGSLRAYFKHERLDGAAIYRNFGRQDLTCDVNFTDLIAWGESLGLKTLSLRTQAEFTGSHAEAATAFQVLEQLK